MATPAETMKAIYQDDYGPADSYKFGTVARPSPGAGEVLLRVRAAAVNPIDLKRNYFLKGDAFPLVGGYDAAGEVAALGGGDVAGLRVGDRVFGEVTGNALAKKTNGTFAQFCAVKAHLLAIAPPAASFAEMAALPVAAGTALQAFDALGLNRGDKVFITAGAGGVGAHAIQIAKNVFGAAEVAVTASAAKHALLRELGADKVVDYKTEDAGAALAGWADVALACTAEIELCNRVAKEGGRVGTIVEMGAPGATSVFLAASGGVMRRIADIVAGGKLKVVIDTVYPLEEGVKAIKHVDGGRAKGKVIIKMD